MFKHLKLNAKLYAILLIPIFALLISPSITNDKKTMVITSEDVIPLKDNADHF